MRGGPGTGSPGQLTGIVTLKTLLMRAYDVKGYQIAGPAWIETERYELAAKIPAGAGKPEVARMLQNLLEARFHLSARREKRQLPLYALMVAKNGPKFRESSDRGSHADPGDVPARGPKWIAGADGMPELAPGSDVPRTYEIIVGGPDGLLHKLWGRGEKMQQFADRLSSQLNRAVVDRTGLSGSYDFALSWTAESAGGIVPRTDPPPDEIEMHNSPVLSDPGLSLFTALPAQMGLRLEQTKGPLETLVIDRADKVPVAN